MIEKITILIDCKGEEIPKELFVEVNCPNCGILVFSGLVNSREHKKFRCEVGEASCGWTWTREL